MKQPLTSHKLGPLALLALFAIGASLPACAAPESVAEEADATDPATPVAQIGDVVITQGELDEASADQLQQAENHFRRQLEEQRQQIFDAQLDQIIEGKLMEIEAAGRGIDQDALRAEAIGDVTDEDLSAFYEENKAQIRGTLEQIKPQLTQYMSQQRFQTFVRELRTKHKVRMLIEPKRVEMAVADAPTKGPDSAPVTIVEFSDFECPFCSRVNPTLAKVAENYPEKVRIAFRQFPLHNLHPNAQKAAEASLCAHDQGKFWELHDVMFADQRNLGVDALKAKAGEVGLDSATFDECLDSGKHAGQVASDLAAGQAAGVSGTPAFFVNGRFLNGAVPYEDMAELIDDELLRQEDAD